MYPPCWFSMLKYKRLNSYYWKDVTNGCSVHCTTQPGAKRGSDVSFSSCTAPNYLVLMSKYFRCILGTLRIPEVSEVVQEFGSNPELECSPERGEHRGQV